MHFTAKMIHFVSLCVKMKSDWYNLIIMIRSYHKIIIDLWGKCYEHQKSQNKNNDLYDRRINNNRSRSIPCA